MAPGNLPAELSSFVGRRKVLQQVRSALRHARLVTVVGPGGVGKTRVALRATGDMQQSDRHGTWLVDLSGLGDPELVPRSVLTALGLRDHSEQSPTTRLIDHLASRRLTLLLDNCEHLAEACAQLAGALLQGVPDLTILATSRQPLRVAGEHLVPVPPLALPNNGGRYSLDRIAEFEAVDLFVARARAATGDFELTIENQDAVARLCQRLDGMPLAIELASARLRVLGVEQILERLDDRFRMLTDDSATAPLRQRSLWATIDWSYRLLAAGEAAVFRRLGVFAGTFDLVAAEAVCASTDLHANEVMELLSSLVDKSLVSREGNSVSARYRLHETVREYALVRLEGSREEESTAERHRRHYGDMCCRLDGDWFSSRIAEWLPRIELEADNIRAALQRCLRDGADPDAGLDLAGWLWEYWATRALGEGVHWLDSVLDRPGGSDGARARALFARGLVAMHQPDLPRSVDLVDEAATLARRAGDVRTLVNTLGLLGAVQALAGRLASANVTAAELRALATAFREPAYLYQTAAADVMIGAIEDDLERARKAYAEGQTLAAQTGEVWLHSHNALNLAWALLRRQEYVEAATLFKQALRHKYELDDRPGITYILEGLACQAAAVCDWRRVASLMGAAAAQHRELGSGPHPVVRPFLEFATAQAVRAWGNRRFQSAFEQGTKLDRDAAVALGLDEHRPKPTPEHHTGPHGMPLGQRELQVARLVAEGLSNKEIAVRLRLSVRTVESHLTHIFQKTGLTRRTQIAGWLAEFDRGR
jgi:predicted ATPase/DNA-binding CsgD family transcriptional regulator